MMIKRSAFILIAGVLSLADVTNACTAFYAAQGDTILVGNNEDYINPRTKVWFVPPENGRYGGVYFGFDDMNSQGGMNERGLFFDGFATAPLQVVRSANKPVCPGNLVDKAMAECATVDEVLALFDRYNLQFLERGMFLFGDATGKSAIIEGDEVIRKKGHFQVVTNFYQSQTPAGQEPCGRYRIATRMLEQSEEISVPLFRSILSAVHAEHDSWTLYSNIYDLKRRIVHVYHFHNFENVVTFDLAKELKKGRRVYDLPSLFPSTYAAEEFARRQIGRLEEQHKVRRATDIDPAVYDRYAGKYQFTDGPIPGLVATILKQGDRLYVDVPGMANYELAPQSPTEFFYVTFDSFIRLTFLQADPDEITSFDVDINGIKATAKRIE